MNLFILPSSIPHAPPSQISLLLNQTSHSLNLRLLHFSKYQPAPALPGRVSSSVFPAPPGYFTFSPHRCASPSRSRFQKSGIQNALLLPLIPPFLTSQNTKKQRQALRLPLSLCRRQLIFPGRLQPSIVSTCELNFRVRYGNGWTLTVINTYYVLQHIEN